MAFPAAVDELLVTADDLRAEPGAPFHEDIVAAAAGRVRLAARWHIAPEVQQTLTIDGPGTQTITLPTLRVAAVLEVREEGRLIAADDYDWSAAGFIIRRTGLWTERPRGIVVTFRHGYGDCPEPLRPVVAEECRRILTNAEYVQDGDATPTSYPLSRESAAIVAAFVIENGP